MTDPDRNRKGGIFSVPVDFPYRNLNRELINFLVLAIAGTIVKYFAVQIPPTDAFIEGRWVVGFMGFVLLHRWWLALLLMVVLSLPVGTNIPFFTGVFGNLLYAVPAMVLIRYIHSRFLVRLRADWQYGVGWFLLVVVCYQAFTTPVVWAVLAAISSQPIFPSFLEGWRIQPFLTEMILVGIISASILVARRTHVRLLQSKDRLDHINRILQAIRNVNQLIVSEANQQGLINKACSSLVETLGYYSAWILLIDRDGKHIIQTAASGFSTCFSQIGTETENGTFPDCIKAALQQDRIISIKDPGTECAGCLLAEDLKNRVYLMRRLTHRKQLYGALAVSVPAQYAFDPEEGSLFEELAGDLSYALHKMFITEDLQKNEIIYQQLYETMIQGVIYCDVDGKIFSANPAALRILGRTLEQLLGADFHNEDWQAFREDGSIVQGHENPISRALKTGRAIENVIMGVKNALKKDYVWIDVSAVPLFRPGDKKPFQVYLTLEDITERKTTEQALKESEARYHSLFESIRDAILVADMDRTIIDCNQAFMDLFGYPRKEIIGKKVLIIHDRVDDYDHLGKMLEDNVDDPKIIYTLQFRKKSGEVFTGEINIYYLHDAEGTPRGYIGFTRDISEQIEAEETRKEIEDRLRQAQKIETVGQLAGGVAHDFNNMLSVILGQAELAMMDIDPNDLLYSPLLEIRKAAESSADLTRQLLGFARKQTIAPIVLDLNAAMEETLTMLRRLIGEDIELNWLPGKDVCPVMMDPVQLNQILSNLCVNARDAIEGVGRITIETSTVSINQEYCHVNTGFIPGDFTVLAVSDNGRGIDQETIKRIFEPFFTTKTTGLKTGLGLSTVYGIVKQNEGFINVYSEPGEGTTFRVYLPCHKGDVKHIQRQDVLVSAGLGETVLLVEDEPTIIEFGKVMLETLGYRVLATGSPGEAVTIARQFEKDISLLITDVIMPEMNGKDLAEKIREIHPEIKILFMSGYTANVIAHRGVLDEGIHFLQKPFLMKDLSLKVREILDSEG
ncbi:MAG: PAS domain S-box protein [Anaerolineales bacterium]|nr:PAS domain S-box protein [Anaerolineales bacterium]